MTNKYRRETTANHILPNDVYSNKKEKKAMVVS